MKKILIVFILLFSSLLQAQYTQIPDPAFETHLIILGIDSDGVINGQVLTSDIEIVTFLDFLNNFTITDLTGIEDFASLEILTLGRINITQLNLSQNINLEELNIGDVSLESINLENNINLRFLSVNFNCNTCYNTCTVTELDLSNNSLLYHFVILESDTITELDLSANNNINDLRIINSDGLTQINLKSGANSNISFLRIQYCDNLACVQVDDPDAVIAGTDPPYDAWIIDEGPIITEDCFLGVEDVILESQIAIYPNPAQNILNINSDIFINSVQVYDVLGRLVLQESNPTNQLDVSKISRGLLFVKLEMDIGIITKKIIKE